MTAHIQVDVLKKIEKYSKGDLNKTKNFETENITKNNHNSSQLPSKKIDIDPTLLSPVQRYLYDELEVVKKKLEDNDGQCQRKLNYYTRKFSIKISTQYNEFRLEKN